MTLCESSRIALDAAHSFIWEEMIVPKVPEDGDYSNRDRYLRKYVKTLDTVERAMQRLATENDPERNETIGLTGEYGDSPTMCPCCGGKAVAESGNGQYGWWAQVRCTECGLKLSDSENPKNSAYNSERCLGDLVGKWNRRAVKCCTVKIRQSDSDYTDEPHYHCSECGGFIPVDEIDPETKMPLKAAKFCPNCGRTVALGFNAG